MAIFPNTKKELRDTLEEISHFGEQAGLTMNLRKTKILSENSDQEAIKIKEKKIEIAEETSYLGQIIAFENRTEREINVRINKAWNKYWSLKSIFKGPFKNNEKSEIFNICIIPTLTYGCQTWPLKEKYLDRIRSTQNSIEHSILNVN